MQIITLTTDFGNTDFHLPLIKGLIYSCVEDVKVVDISSQISPFDIKQAAFIIKNCYKHFPEGTIHIIGIDALDYVDKKPLVVEINKHFFIGIDNGIFSLIEQDKAPDNIYQITGDNLEENKSFLIQDLFVPTACFLAKKRDVSLVGTKIDSFQVLKNINPTQREDALIGNIIFIDRYGNAVTNIKKDNFNNFVQGRRFLVCVRDKYFGEVYNKYVDIIEGTSQEENIFVGKAMAIFNSAEYLQISIFKGNLETYGGASSLLGIDYETRIRVQLIKD